jgi:hypothetical protein
MEDNYPPTSGSMEIKETKDDHYLKQLYSAGTCYYSVPQGKNTLP